MSILLRPIETPNPSIVPAHETSLDVSFRHLDDRGGRLRAMIEREAALLRSIDHSIVNVGVTVERLQKHRSVNARYRVRLRVQLPGRLLVGGRPRGGGEYADPQAALADAFRSLRHQLRGSRRRRRVRRRRA
jgi:ribosome-associated translation inhibitor RaiA